MKQLLGVLLSAGIAFANSPLTIDDLAQADTGVFFEEGKKYYKEKNYTKAFEYFEKSAALGNYKAQYNLGVLYANPKFYLYNQEKAFEQFKQLAHKGHAASQNRLGMYYTLGGIVEKDYLEAIKWYEQSSKQGYVTAQCNLAYMYAAGKGVFVNFGRAHAFAKEGFKNKHPLCTKVWKDYNLQNYPEDKGFKFGSTYVKP